MDMILLIGLVGVLISIASARMISESAERSLSIDEKMKLEGAFAGYKKFSFLLLIPLGFVCWVLITGNYALYLISVIIFFAFLIFYFIFTFFIARKKITDLGIHNNYIKKLFLSFAVRFLGIAIFCGIIVYSNISGKY